MLIRLNLLSPSVNLPKHAASPPHSMQAFHVSLHAAPSVALATEVVQLDRQPLTRLVVGPEQLQQPLSVTFDEAAQRLQQLPRLFLEPDGSFVWVAASGETSPWQLDGLLNDRGGNLQTVELKGTCPASAWDQLARICSAIPGRLIVQLMRPALFVAEQEFRRFQFNA